VSSRGSCIRCSRTVEVESTTGLCPDCLRTVHSPASTPRDVVARPIELFAPTVDEVVTPSSGTGEETHTHQAGAEPRTLPISAPPRVPLPTAPAGYEILGELGLGGMGAVYLAREVVPDRLVAMKFLRRPGSQTAYDRFLVEVRALAALDHPNIIRVITTDFFRSDPFFTTEYFPNGSLLKRVDESGVLDPVEAAKIMAAAARAVHAANQKDVIHRDLKPSNILLTADGVPKVADFGLAKRLNREDDLTTATGALGSPPYMAPEQTGQCAVETVDARTDVYGLGATLYHLVTGCRPFVGDTPEQVIGRVLVDPPPRPRSVRPELPRELEAIILKCLEKDPSRRYPSGEALAADLDRFLAGRPPEAPLLTLPRRVGQRIRKNRKPMAVAVAVPCLFAIATMGAWLALTPADPLKEIERSLAEGDEVTLIGEKGLPKWHRWVLGSPELGLSSTGDGTCSFESMGRAFLEMCRDPMSNHYRVRADVRFARSKLPAEAAPGGEINGVTTAGVYFGYSASPGNAGATAHAMFVVGFDDSPRRGGAQGAEARKSAVHLRRFIELQDPNGGKPVSVKSTLAYAHFDAAVALPGPWRTIEIEISSDGVQASWLRSNGTMDRFAAYSTDVIRTEYAGLLQKLDLVSPNHGVLLPNWSPRMPLGIWNDRAAIDIRNVIVTPIR
jgi:hypothetical protein